MRQLDDIVVSVVPGAWSATRLVHGIGRTGHLVSGVVVVGWCGARELRLVRGPTGGRLAPVVDLVVSAQRPPSGAGARGRPLTLTDLPDGHLMFDELAAGRKLVVAELVPPGAGAVRRWLRVLAATAEPAVEDGDGRAGSLVRAAPGQWAG